jgi:flagellar motility protein MotE (MotC chaperone)
MRENLMTAAEKRVDGKITELKSLQAQIQALLGQRDAQQEKQMAALVKVYSAMKPRDAARIFAELGDGVLIPVAGAMKPDALAPILAAMPPDAAQKLTQKLAGRFATPEPKLASATPTPAPALALAATTPPAATAAPSPAAPSPAPPAQAAPAPAAPAPAKSGG